MDKNTKISDKQLQKIQTKYELQISETIEHAIRSSGKSILATDNDIKEVVNEYNIDTKELVIEAKNNLEEQPDISDESLAINLLSKIANNKKYKGLSKIAKEMLEEKWWEKNV